MTNDPKQGASRPDGSVPSKPKQTFKISEEEVEQAIENVAKDVEEEGAFLNISCSI